ncbi:MAG: OsmC family protein [Saprospiraceae bacterium]|nr:OsmC family protein [Saprospiraceae bacterium]
MSKRFEYNATIVWTGNSGSGTDNYVNYERSHIIKIDNKVDILGSSDTAFRGDRAKHNPEELLISSLSACHMLWYLHLCSEAGVVVTHYTDHANGVMEVASNGGGRFTEVTLHPSVTVDQQSMVSKAIELHKKANELCFIANSVNFPVKHEPTIEVN